MGWTRHACDFQINKKVICEVAIIASTRLRNKIAGYATRRGSAVRMFWMTWHSNTAPSST